MSWNKLKLLSEDVDEPKRKQHFSFWNVFFVSMDSFDICLIARLRFEVATFYLSKSIFDPFKIYIIQLNCNSYNTTLAEKSLVMIEHFKRMYKIVMPQKSFTSWNSFRFTNTFKKIVLKHCQLIAVPRSFMKIWKFILPWRIIVQIVIFISIKLKALKSKWNFVMIKSKLLKWIKLIDFAI